MGNYEALIVRHGKEEVEKMGLDNLWAVSAILGSQPYLFGDDPSELDAVVFAFVAITICSADDDDSPFKKAILEDGGDLANLKQHFDRVKDRFFPDWEKLLSKSS
jgi:glutathione S-transferase